MMKKSDERVCRKCGRRVTLITWGVYRSVLVDPDAVMVHAEEGGEEFVRIDGTKVQGRIIPYESTESAEPAYRMHRKSCGERAENRTGWEK